MKSLLRRILLSRKTVYMAALMATIFVVIGSLFYIFEIFALMSFVFFALGTVSVCCSWLSFILYDRVITKRLEDSGRQNIRSQFNALESLVDAKLKEHIEQQLSEYKTHSFYNLLSLEELKDYIAERHGGSRAD